MTVPAIANLVHETTTGTGTGNLTLTPYSQSFNQAFGNGATTNVFFYFIQHRTAAEWEYGTGHMSAATTLVRDTVVQSSNANALVNFSAGTKDVANDLPAEAQRIPLHADTNYYVATTGNDTTGDGSSGNPWRTIQHAADYVMFRVAADDGVAVTINVASGTYAEGLKLGPHQVGSFNSTWTGPTISFASTVTLAPTGLVYSATLGTCAVINCFNANWSLIGDFHVTVGSSTIQRGLAAWDGGILSVDNGTLTFTDPIVVAFDAEVNSAIYTAGQSNSQNIVFSSTVGTLAMVEANDIIHFYPGTAITFSVDPGFSGGMWYADHGSNCSISSRATYSGTCASPAQSLVSRGNYVYDLNAFMPFSAITLDGFNSFYNGGCKSLGVGTNAPTDANGVVTLFVKGPTGHDVVNLTDGTVEMAVFLQASAHFPVQFGSITNHDFGLLVNNANACVINLKASGDTINLFETPSTVKAAITDSSGTLKLTTIENELLLEQTGDTLGATSLHLQNRAGANGAVFANDGVDLVDFGFSPSSNLTPATYSQANIRWEHRDASVSTPNNFANSGSYSGEWQLLIGSTNPGGQQTPLAIGYQGYAFMGGGNPVYDYNITVSGGGHFFQGAAYRVCTFGGGNILDYGVTDSNAWRVTSAPFGLASYTVGALPTGVVGQMAYVTDGDAALAWGATVINSGAGATNYLVWFNGSNWTVMGA